MKKNKNRPCEPDTSQQQERMRAPKIHALDKHIVSFGAAKRKRNTRSLLAVIFIPKNSLNFEVDKRKDDTYGKSKIR